MNPTSVEASAEVAKSAMETVIAAMSDVFTLSGTVVTEITKQPILLFCLAAGLVPVGIGIFSRLKNAARGLSGKPKGARASRPGPLCFFYRKRFYI